jgi:hypothetical protein
MSEPIKMSARKVIPTDGQWHKAGDTAIQSGRYTISKNFIGKEEVRYVLYDVERRVGVFSTIESAKSATEQKRSIA